MDNITSSSINNNLIATYAVNTQPILRDRLPKELDEYDQIEQVGEGGMAFVYRVRNKQLNRIEAMKVIRSGSFADEADILRFKFEAEAVAGLSHPYIVPVYRIGELQKVPYFTMKWIDSGSLLELASEIRKDSRTIADIMAKIAQAIQHAHLQGILHRDLKPANILLSKTADGSPIPMVSDFGLAKRSDGTDSRMTMTGVVIGTPCYMSPEQARGDRRVTTAVDIYGIGTILYELLTGRPPYVGTSIPDVVNQVLQDPPLAPHHINPEVDKDLEAVCLKCLEKNPLDRYPSAAALSEEFERASRGEPVLVRPPGLGEWLVRELHKSPPYFAGYVWQIKIWFGLIILTANLGVFVLAKLDASIVWVALLLLFAWSSSTAVLWGYMAARFTRLPTTEQHSVMIAIGHLIGHVAFTFSVLQWNDSAVSALNLYPGYTAITGLAFFVVGTTHWGRFYWFGMSLFALTPVMHFLPDIAPVLYGSVVAACMWWWAYAVRKWFVVKQEAQTELQGSQHRSGRNRSE